MNDYSEKLKDPRWQKVRLLKMEESAWSCQICGDGSEELNVHHKYYSSDRSPWEYQLSDLECLCRTCHELSHTSVKKLCSFALSHEQVNNDTGPCDNVLVALMIVKQELRIRGFPNNTKQECDSIASEYRNAQQIVRDKIKKMMMSIHLDRTKQ